MLDLLNNFIITYSEYSTFLQENFTFVNPNGEIAFLSYILVLILLFNIIKFFLQYMLELLKVIKSLFSSRKGHF